MVSRRYVGDYRLENVADRKGRTVTRPVYRGDIFNFEKSDEEMIKTKRLLFRTTIMEWMAYIFALLNNSDKGRVMYVSLPLIAVAFPLLGQSSIIHLIRAGGEYKREEKDRITERLVSYSFISLFFALCSFACHVGAWIKSGESVEDAVVLSLTAALIALSYSVFSKRKDLSMKKTGSTVLPETEEEK